MAMRIVFSILTLAACLSGQTARSVVLAWEDALNPPGTAYIVYRAAGTPRPRHTPTRRWLPGSGTATW